MKLSTTLRKSLNVQLGEEAGVELAGLLQHLLSEVGELSRGKVDVTPIAPVSEPPQRGTFHVKLSDGSIVSANPSHAVADRLVCHIPMTNGMRTHRIVGVDECASEADKEAFKAAWRELGGAAMGLAFEDGTPYEPG
jgi:hypothetical protein